MHATVAGLSKTGTGTGLTATVSTMKEVQVSPTRLTLTRVATTTPWLIPVSHCTSIMFVSRSELRIVPFSTVQL